MQTEILIDLPKDADRMAWDVRNPDGTSPLLEIDAVKPSPSPGLNERGAIIFPEVFRIKPSSDTGLGMNQLYVGQFDPTAVGVGLLLFDRLDHPLHSMLCPEPGVPLGLEEWVGFQRSIVSCGGQMSFGMFSQIALAVFNALDSRDEGLWSIIRGKTGIGLPADKLDPRAGFQIRLLNALSVPDGEMPYEDILLFKDRRRDELLALRKYLDELVIEVSKFGFGGLAETVAFERFYAALAAYGRIMKESNFVKKVINLDISFSWPDLIKNPALNATLAAIIGQTIALPPTFTSLLSTMSFASTYGLRRLTSSPSPFDYLVSAGEEIWNST